MIQQDFTALNRYVHDSGTDNGLVPVPFNLFTPFRGPIIHAPFNRMQEASPTGKHGGKKLQLLTPEIGYIRILTRRNATPARVQTTGRLAANGYVDPYTIRQGGNAGTVTPDFRFVP